MSFAYEITSEVGDPLVLRSRVDARGQDLPGPSRSVDDILSALSRKAIFLSASENIARQDERDNIAKDIVDRHTRRMGGAPWLDRYLHYIQHEDHRYPRRVLRAVSWLSTFALENDYTLIFGGHPAISPMVLEVARRFATNHDEVRVVIFQSELYANIIPIAAKDISRWPNGCMLTTRAVGRDKNESLTLMRRHMLSAPGLHAGVYIGGMGGILEESYRFEELQRGKPRYAIGSTGGASEYLLDAMGDEHCGRMPTRELRDALADDEAYAAVIDQIFDDLEAAP
ncbi:MAG: hypothetical protein KC501_30330 [Myxococcales bacterium]|nr:hypothetical protein [Myxococcales bacterium]